jgi:hypothetical protein
MIVHESRFHFLLFGRATVTSSSIVKVVCNSNRYAPLTTSILKVEKCLDQAHATGSSTTIGSLPMLHGARSL